MGSFQLCPHTTRGLRRLRLSVNAPDATMSPTESLLPTAATKHSTIPCASSILNWPFIALKWMSSNVPWLMILQSSRVIIVSIYPDERKFISVYVVSVN